jgi:hypothetical protein
MTAMARPWLGCSLVLGLVAACGGDDDAAGADAAPGGCDPVREACTYAHDFGVQALTGGEERDSLCQSWTLGNATELWVNSVTLENDGGYHHSNWVFVPDDQFVTPDGARPCDEFGFDEFTGAIAGGVLFAQSTQAPTQTQAFRAGAAVLVPAHARIIGSTHLLNLGDGPLETGLRMTVRTIPEAEVTAPLQPFRLTYHDLHIPAMSDAEFTSTCDIGPEYAEATGVPFAMKLHYVMPHFHELGSRFDLRVVGGAMDGELIYQQIGYDTAGWGHTYDPPLELGGASGITGLRFTCAFHNQRAADVGWGIGDQEMCVMLGFTESEYPFLFDGTVRDGTGMVVSSQGGVVSAEGPCEILGIAR